MAIYSPNINEQYFLGHEADKRAEKQKQEAGKAQAIADRDELVVAGEDTEREATQAANLAKQQLGAAAGGGAAALAGMEAAQGARDKVFGSRLQAARQRKDVFEQKAVDRRNKALETTSSASGMRQLANADAKQATDMAEREELIAQYLDKAAAHRSSSSSSSTSDEKAGGAVERDYNDPETYRPAMEGAQLIYAEAMAAFEKSDSESERNELGKKAREAEKDYKRLYKLFTEAGGILSDYTLKQVLITDGDGPNFGKIGKPKNRYIRAKKDAEAMIESDGVGGLNSILVSKYHGK